jgi:hypothetical protein
VTPEVFPACYHPPPPAVIGGTIRHINIYIFSMESIMPETNSIAAMTATQQLYVRN